MSHERYANQLCKRGEDKHWEPRRPPIMTKDAAIYRRLLIAISELHRLSASQHPLGGSTPDDAITMLEEVIEALQKCQMEYNEAITMLEEVIEALQKRQLEHTQFAA